MEIRKDEKPVGCIERDDTLGRAIQVLTTIDGATYVMGATYDANSRLTTIAYPSGFTARYAYNALGYSNQPVTPDFVGNPQLGFGL